MKIGRALCNPDTGKKLYWSLINIILNKAKMSRIPPLLENDISVMDFTAKAEIFDDYFIQQCTTIDTGSELPLILVPNAPLLTSFSISDEKILNIIRSLNPNKARGWDDISVRMMKICDNALLLPLRIIFQSCMSQGVFPEVWKQANVSSKCRQGIGMLRLLSKYLPRNTLYVMYKLYVRPHLDYGDIMYHIPQNICEFSQTVTLTNLMEKLESVQYSAALAITGAWKGTSRQKIYGELGWESLNLRRWSRRLVLFYKIINDLTPDYTSSPVPQLQESDYSLRRRAPVGQIRARTERFKSSFYLTVCRNGKSLTLRLNNPAQ